MINDPLISEKDSIWREVDIAALNVSLNRKAGGLRDLYISLYDEATTERECSEIREQALVEIDRLAAIPKEPTVEERLVAMQVEINELKTRIK